MGVKCCTQDDSFGALLYRPANLLASSAPLTARLGARASKNFLREAHNSLFNFIL